MQAYNNGAATLVGAVTENSMFIILPWHRLYADALKETDPAKLPEFIRCAEQAIRKRYLEIKRFPTETDETVDLGHAIAALRQLKIPPRPENHLDVSSSNDVPKQGTALGRALDKSEQVHSKVTECAEELSSVNINIKEEIVHPSPAERVRPALERIEKVENKVQECADDLLAVNETLEKEIAERKHLEHLLAHTQIAEDEARRSALHDLLTGLPNRSLFDDRLEHALADAKRNSLSLAVMFIDLDNFKRINDAHGHHAGDRMLRLVAERLESSVRANDTVSRHGGDEFLYLCMDVQKKIDVVNIAHKLFDVVSAPFESNGTKFIVRPSIGIAIYPNDGEAADVLLKNADTAMYKAKQGKTGIEFFSNVGSL